MFEKNLKNRMKEAKLTAAELSRRTGISKAAISQYLSGINRPCGKRIDKLAEALGCTVMDLVNDMSEPAASPTCCQPGRMVGVWNPQVLTTQQAAKLMHKSVKFVQQGLQEGVFPFGYAVKTSGQWSYFISAVKFTECTGIPV